MSYNRISAERRARIRYLADTTTPAQVLAGIRPVGDNPRAKIDGAIRAAELAQTSIYPCLRTRVPAVCQHCERRTNTLIHHRPTCPLRAKPPGCDGPECFERAHGGWEHQDPCTVLLYEAEANPIDCAALDGTEALTRTRTGQ